MGEALLECMLPNGSHRGMRGSLGGNPQPLRIWGVIKIHDLNRPGLIGGVGGIVRGPLRDRAIETKVATAPAGSVRHDARAARTRPT